MVRGTTRGIQIIKSIRWIMNNELWKVDHGNTWNIIRNQYWKICKTNSGDSHFGMWVLLTPMSKAGGRGGGRSARASWRAGWRTNGLRVSEYFVQGLRISEWFVQQNTCINICMCGDVCMKIVNYGHTLWAPRVRVDERAARGGIPGRPVRPCMPWHGSGGRKQRNRRTSAWRVANRLTINDFRQGKSTKSFENLSKSFEIVWKHTQKSNDLESSNDSPKIIWRLVQKRENRSTRNRHLGRQFQSFDDKRFLSISKSLIVLKSEANRLKSIEFQENR